MDDTDDILSKENDSKILHDQVRTKCRTIYKDILSIIILSMKLDQLKTYHGIWTGPSRHWTPSASR